MRIRFVALLLVALSVVLWGCTANQQQAALSGASLVSTAVSLDSAVQSGQVERTVFQIKHSEDNTVIVAGFLEDWATARGMIAAVSDDPAQLLRAREILDDAWILVSTSYPSFRAVVEARWDEYDPVAQSYFLRWQAKLDRLVIQRNNVAAALDADLSEDARREKIVELARIMAQIGFAVYQAQG